MGKCIGCDVGLLGQVGRRLYVEIMRLWVVKVGVGGFVNVLDDAGRAGRWVGWR